MRAASLCAVSTAAQAQTLTTFVSNSERAVDPGSVRDIQAQRFVTGANADRYTIFEVRLRVAIGSGADTRVRIREENNSTSPGDLVATLTNPGTLMNNSLNKFTAPAGTTLDANKAYWITVNEGIPRASQAFFSNTAAPGQTGGAGWKIGDSRRGEFSTRKAGPLRQSPFSSISETRPAPPTRP